MTCWQINITKFDYVYTDACVIHALLHWYMYMSIKQTESMYAQIGGLHLKLVAWNRADSRYTYPILYMLPRINSNLVYRHRDAHGSKFQIQAENERQDMTMPGLNLIFEVSNNVLNQDVQKVHLTVSFMSHSFLVNLNSSAPSNIYNVHS